MNHRVVIGKFGKPQGLKGLIRIYSYTVPVGNFITYEPKLVQISGEWRELAMSDYNVQDKFILAKVAGYVEREALAALTNAEIATDVAALPRLAPDEYYWHDLVGLTVYNQHNILLGKIIEVMATGANDVLIIQGEERILVPFIPDEYITTIDVQNNIMMVNWDTDF